MVLRLHQHNIGYKADGFNNFSMHWLDWAVFYVPAKFQHSTGYMGDGFYRSKDPTNSIKVLKRQIVHRQIKHTISKH